MLEAKSSVTVDDTVDKDSTELSKYWKTVRETPSDFNGWIYLLQYVEQEVRIVIATDIFYKTG